VSASVRAHDSCLQAAGVLRHQIGAWALLVMLLTGCGRLGYEGLGEELGSPASATASDDNAGDGDSALGGGVIVDGDEEGLETPVDDGDDESSDGDDGAAGPVSAAPTFANLCHFPGTVVVTDGSTIDDSAGAAMRAAVLGTCLGFGMRTVSQDAAGVLDATTDRPLLGPDELVVMAGSLEAQRGLAYIDAHDAPVVRRDGANLELVEASSGRVVLSVSTSSVNLTHDYALLMMSDEPVSRTTVLSSSGFGELGTLAGARWLSENSVDGSKRWVLIEWRANDPGDNADDSYLVVASG
jgi:hypothetical protein